MSSSSDAFFNTAINAVFNQRAQRERLAFEEKQAQFLERATFLRTMETALLSVTKKADIGPLVKAVNSQAEGLGFDPKTNPFITDISKTTLENLVENRGVTSAAMKSTFMDAVIDVMDGADPREARNNLMEKLGTIAAVEHDPAARADVVRSFTDFIMEERRGGAEESVAIVNKEKAKLEFLNSAMGEMGDLMQTFLDPSTRVAVINGLAKAPGIAQGIVNRQIMGEEFANVNPVTQTGNTADNLRTAIESNYQGSPGSGSPMSKYLDDVNFVEAEINRETQRVYEEMFIETGASVSESIKSIRELLAAGGVDVPQLAVERYLRDPQAPQNENVRQLGITIGNLVDIGALGPEAADHRQEILDLFTPGSGVVVSDIPESVLKALGDPRGTYVDDEGNEQTFSIIELLTHRDGATPDPRGIHLLQKLDRDNFSQLAGEDWESMWLSSKGRADEAMSMGNFYQLMDKLAPPELLQNMNEDDLGSLIDIYRDSGIPALKEALKGATPVEGQTRNDVPDGSELDALNMSSDSVTTRFEAAANDEIRVELDNIFQSSVSDALAMDESGLRKREAGLKFAQQALQETADAPEPPPLSAPGQANQTKIEEPIGLSLGREILNGLEENLTPQGIIGSSPKRVGGVRALLENPDFIGSLKGGSLVERGAAGAMLAAESIFPGTFSHGLETPSSPSSDSIDSLRSESEQRVSSALRK